MDAKTCLICTATAVAFASCAANVRVGFRETEGVNVGLGETSTFDGELSLGTEAKFYKTGPGVLEMSQSQIDNRTDVRLTVLDGTLRLTSGTYSPSVSASAVIANEAALWLTPDSAVTTNSAEEISYVTRWKDKRDNDNGTLLYQYAGPKWHEKNGVRCENYGIPPVKETRDGRVAVYFGGGQSGKYMRLYTPSGDESTILNEKIHHLYIVHGAYEWWGSLIGTRTGYRFSSFVTTLSSTLSTLANTASHFDRRSEFTPAYAGALTWLDGERINPYDVPPKNGFQLLELDNHVKPSSFHDIAKHLSETISGVQGADYISEIVVFTNRLQESERMDVERYLMAKYDLESTSYPMKTNDLARTVSLVVASNAVLEISAPTDTSPVALSGEGLVRKTGAGKLVLGPSLESADFTGTIDIQEGSVFAKGGMVPPVAVKAGDTVSAKMTSTVYANTREAAINSGLELAVEATAPVATVVKAGGGLARVNSIAADVHRLEVSEGKLSLEAPVIACSVVPGGVLSAVVQNADFEQLCDGDPTQYGVWSIPTGTGRNGWRKISGTVAYIGVTNSWTVFIGGNNVFPSGNKCLQIQGAGEVATTVSFPKAGYYELSFYARTRTASYSSSARETSANNAFSRPLVALRLGSTDATLETFGYWQGSPSAFNKFRYRLPHVEAGDYSFSFKSVDGANDGTSYFDDVKIVYVAENEANTAFKIPNGDFESFVRPSAAPFSFPFMTTRQEATGWTFTQDAGYESCVTNPPVAVVNIGVQVLSSSTSASLWMFDPSLFKFGSAALAFISAHGSASVTFTPPAGTYHLKARIVDWGAEYWFNGGSSQYWHNVPKVSALVERAGGGGSESLGVVNGARYHGIADRLWPTAVSFDGEESVTLTIRNTETVSACLLDDLELIPVDQPYKTGNLIVNGGLEEGSAGWSVFLDKTGKQYAGADFQSYSTLPGNWGYSIYEGTRCLKLQNKGCAYQTVSFPTKGLYRLRFHARIRPDYPWYGFNSLRAWVHPDGDNSKTNVIGWTTMSNTNFVEHSFVFEVPSAGDYRVALQGMGNPAYKDSTNEDCSSIIDGISLEQVTETFAATPDMPNDLSINVSDGALLSLDFPGTQKVRRLVLGGVPYSGLVTEATDPEHLAGRGALLVEPRGLIISIH